MKSKADKNQHIEQVTSSIMELESNFGSVVFSEDIKTLTDLCPFCAEGFFDLNTNLMFEPPFVQALKQEHDYWDQNPDCTIPSIYTYAEPTSRWGKFSNHLIGLERGPVPFNYSEHCIHAGLIKISHQAECEISEYVGPALAALSRGVKVWNQYPSVVSQSTLIGKGSDFYSEEGMERSELSSLFPSDLVNLNDPDDEWMFPRYDTPKGTLANDSKEEFLSKLHYEVHHQNTGIIVIDDIERIFRDLSVNDPFEQEDFIKHIGILAEAYRIPILVVDPEDKVPEYAWHMHWETKTDKHPNGDRSYQLWVTSKIEKDIPNPVLDVKAIPTK